MAKQTESEKKPKKKEGWMGFYNGRIPKKLITKKTRKKRVKRHAFVAKKHVIHECPYCTNKSNEGSGDYVFDGSWVCSPCIVKHDISTLKSESLDDVSAGDNNEEDGFKQLDPWEIERHEQRQKSKNIWLLIFGIIIMAIILSLVERSRVFSVMAVVALIAVFLLYRYEVKI